ncbi:hypothetical protein BN432_3508 [Erwinia amylovora Ea356]|nr:hypothetical protein BN432_3508 [Erwinia amylovora Ea356]
MSVQGLACAVPCCFPPLYINDCQPVPASRKNKGHP